MPKWKNKGHEFDELGNYFKEHNEIVILGQDINDLSRIERKLEFLSKVGVKVRCERFNYLTYKFVQLLKINLFGKKNVIIVPQNDAYTYSRLFKINSFIQNKNLFCEEEFFGKYLSIFALYVADKVYFPSNSFICTTVCTLNCKDCLNFAPYDKHKVHYDLDRLKKNADTYLKCVDRVGLFHISGGEPFTHPNLKELIEYIHDNYKDKIETIAVVTNMTVMPSDELCETLKKTQILVQLDDYTDTNTERKEQYTNVLAKLKSYNVNIEEIPAGTLWNWVSAFPPKEILNDEKKLIEKYNCCGSVFQEIKDGKLFGCCYCEFIKQANVFDYQENDYFDLNTYTPDKKRELVEFRLKYNEKGYVEFCKYCNGLPPYNKEYVKPAIQTKGYLEWDINNPTTAKEA